MPQVVEGKQIAQDVLTNLKGRVEKLKANGKEAALAVVLVGNDHPSRTYVRKKGETARAVGITFFKFEYPDSISQSELMAEMKKIQSEHKLTGMILQLPVPNALWPVARDIADSIDITIDVDCLSYAALGRVLMRTNPLVPPTPGAIMHILSSYGVTLEGKEICLVGRGDLIGKPLVAMLAHEPVTFTVCGKATKELHKYTARADIIISGVGKKDLITGDMVKPGAVVVDAGVCFVDGKMYGDIEFDSVAARAELVTPTPGGVGPITVAKLLENTVKVAERMDNSNM